MLIRPLLYLKLLEVKVEPYVRLVEIQYPINHERRKKYCSCAYKIVNAKWKNKRTKNNCKKWKQFIYKVVSRCFIQPGNSEYMILFFISKFIIF